VLSRINAVLDFRLSIGDLMVMLEPWGAGGVVAHRPLAQFVAHRSTRALMAPSQVRHGDEKKAVFRYHCGRAVPQHGMIVQ
jgi:hypothetical protein